MTEIHSKGDKAIFFSEVSKLQVADSNHLLEVLVDLGQLGGELLVLEGVALLVQDLGHGGDQQQPLLGVDLREADGLAGGQLHGGARRLLASQVPESFRGLSQLFGCH